MKKNVIIVIASLLLLTSCAGNETVVKSNAPEITTQSTEAVTTTAETEETESETETKTEAPETTAPESSAEEEVKLEGMTFRIDTSKWETLDEYIERKENSGDPIDEETKADIRSTPGIFYVLRNTETVLCIQAAEFKDVEGFGTEENYKQYAAALKYTQEQAGAGNNITSQIAERGGLMFLDSYLSYADGTDGRICTVMKDHFGYSFILTNTSRRSDREYLYHIIENLSFD